MFSWQRTSNGCISRHNWSRHVGSSGRWCKNSATDDGRGRQDSICCCGSNDDGRLRWSYYYVTDSWHRHWISHNGSIHATIRWRDDRPTCHRACLLLTTPCTYSGSIMQQKTRKQDTLQGILRTSFVP